MATIRITDLTLEAIIGINSWERTTKQEVIINITLDFDSSKAAKSDNIKDTLDYKDLKKSIMTLVESSKFMLLEKLVERVLDLIMKDPKVLKATVRIDKPRALRFAKSVSIESSRSKTTQSPKTRKPL
ncbi:MAG: dihydroneopterin aldolase [Candidatus Omnitrophica bacterium]|nr:dihydroneopterin aldolase [Candidatus Omnitrophota bacterium]